jgi:3-oxoacyl-[acyl-carrier-protein] synthase-3
LFVELLLNSGQRAGGQWAGNCYDNFWSGMMNSIIIGTGSYIPTKTVCNEDFLGNVFFDANGIRLDKDNREIIEQFEKITEIKERRRVSAELVSSDIAYFAAEDALA